MCTVLIEDDVNVNSPSSPEPDLNDTAVNSFTDLTIGQILQMSEEEFRSIKHLVITSSQNSSPEESKKTHHPTVSFNSEGKIVFNSNSLVINAPTNDVTKKQKVAPQTIWGKKQTFLFYLGIRLFGLNFNDISIFVGNNVTRRHACNKYKLELNRNREYVNFAEKNPLCLELSELEELIQQ